VIAQEFPGEISFDRDVMPAWNLSLLLVSDSGMKRTVIDWVRENLDSGNVDSVIFEEMQFRNGKIIPYLGYNSNTVFSPYRSADSEIKRGATRDIHGCFPVRRNNEIPLDITENDQLNLLVGCF
jgi:hypothetical protein